MYQRAMLAHFGLQDLILMNKMNQNKIYRVLFGTDITDFTMIETQQTIYFKCNYKLQIFYLKMLKMNL